MNKWEDTPQFDRLWEAICALRGQVIKDNLGESLIITRTGNNELQFNNSDTVQKSDICEAVCFWNDVSSINAREGWKHIVPLLDSCRDLADQFMVRAG